jgi:hypothetical protein
LALSVRLGLSVVHELMASTKPMLAERDVVALRMPVGTWPAGVTGTVVSLYGVRH